MKLKTIKEMEHSFKRECIIKNILCSDWFGKDWFKCGKPIVYLDTCGVIDLVEICRNGSVLARGIFRENKK